MSTKELLQKHLAELQAEKTALEEQSAPLRAELDDLNRQREEITSKIREKAETIAAIERPRIIVLSAEISAVAKALGGRAMSDNKAA